jgi:DNA-binding winged helix-turn-helix (wHTH) protein
MVRGMEFISGRITLNPKQVLRSRGQSVGRHKAYKLDPKTRELSRNGLPLKRLTQQEMTVLTLLVSAAPEVVDLDRIQAEVWSSSPPLDSDRRIRDLIGRIREALSDSAREPRFIETITGRNGRAAGATASSGTNDRSASA